MKRIVLLLVLTFGTTIGLSAQESSTLWPDVPKATGDPHPEGSEYWRRNHMDLMRHDRDLTMRDGDRQVGASLTGCFDCHTTKDESGVVLTYESEKHFCRTCHDFVAVRVDCFMCHRSTPDGVDEGNAHASLLPDRILTADEGAILAYLKQFSSQIAQANQ